MKNLNKNSIVTIVAAVSLIFGSFGLVTALAFSSPETVNLGDAGNFAILSTTGITNDGTHLTVITGDIGSSGITAAAMDDVFCSEITGTIYGDDEAYTGSGDTSCFSGSSTLVANAVGDQLAAYNDAIGREVQDTRAAAPADLGGLTLPPGVYGFTGPGNVIITSDLYLDGSATDKWIFIIPGTLDISSSVSVILLSDAKADNIVWAVAGTTQLQTDSVFEGNIISGPGASTIALRTGAILHGRALGGTDVTLQGNTVTAPDTVLVPFTHTQKNTTTWVQTGINANVVISTVDGKFHADGVPAGHTLVYYPDTDANSNGIGYESADYTGDVYPVEGTNMNLPMANDLNGGELSDYCTNGYNPTTEPCQGAKLWLVPDADISATINANGSQTLTWDGANFLFETGLINYAADTIAPTPTPTPPPVSHGGGGGGGTTYCSATVTTFCRPTSGQVLGASVGQVLGATAFNYTRDLTVGSQGADVTALQEMLVSQGHLTMPTGVAYGYFGPLTRAAVASWQAANSVNPPLGYFGSVSRSALASMGGTSSTVSAQIALIKAELMSLMQQLINMLQAQIVAMQ